MKWKDAPQTANYLLTLEGGTQVWSEILTETVDILGQKKDVVDSVKRPEYKTFLHMKEGGKLCIFEVDGMLSHVQARKLLRDEGLYYKGMSFVLEYEEIV